MKSWMWMSAGVGVMMAAGVAVAQVPPTMPPAAPGTPPPAEMHAGPGHDGMRMEHGPMEHGPMEHGPMGPHMGWMMRHMMEAHRPPPSKAAHFRFRKGDAMVDIKCADDEPTKACVDAGSALLDKLAAQPK
jgi:uncharacterized iron-regulated membrane protein